jgi:hypothetical protein
VEKHTVIVSYLTYAGRNISRGDMTHSQCPDEIVPDKSTSTTLRNTPLTYKHDSAGSFSITGNQLNRVYVRARDYAKLYWSTCPVLFLPDTAHSP